MNQDIMMRVLLFGLFGFVFAWLVFTRHQAEMSGEQSKSDRQKYLPYIPSILLPMYILIWVIFSVIYLGILGAAKLTLTMFFGIFLHISVYYFVLILILPFFRKHISARTCAMLWVIPNYLYLTIQLSKPWIVIQAPGNIVRISGYIWFAGFLLVMTCKTIEHLIFRHHVLKDALPVTDPEILSLWNKMIAEVRIKKVKFELVSSPHVKAPISIGLFRSTTKVILPIQNYTSEDLNLILKHELIHIAREDTWSKFFLVFCTAMCWFNPLMWIAMRKCAEDIELSCDETVLLNADDLTRKRYATLLLDTAGNSHGFTTCLSASTNTMRYRLKSIMKPTKRHSGAIIIGIVLFVLFMTSGFVALAYENRSGADVIYANQDFSQYDLRCISMASDEKAFHEYLSSLTLSELTGNYSFLEYEPKYFYLMDGPEGTQIIQLYDKMIKITTLYGENARSSYYYIQDDIDWQYLNTIIVAHPTMDLQLSRSNGAYGEHFSAHLTSLWKSVDGDKKLIYDAKSPEEETHGQLGDDPYDELVFYFSEKLAAPCSVQVETWDRSNHYTITLTDMTQPFVLEVPEYPAHYTFYISYYHHTGGLYEAVFEFDIE